MKNLFLLLPGFILLISGSLMFSLGNDDGADPLSNGRSIWITETPASDEKVDPLSNGRSIWITEIPAGDDKVAPLSNGRSIWIT